jgi:hypothetical protein
MLLINAFQNALAIRLGTIARADAMHRTVTRYTCVRPG